MAGLLPASVYGLRVPAGGLPLPAAIDFPATFRITMAAIDPTAAPQLDSDDTPVRATLKLIREHMDDDDSDDEDFDDIEAIKARLAGVISDEEDSEDDDSEDEKNGGPSDPAKTKQARKEALSKALQKAIEEEDEMELDDKPNGVNGKGKAKAVDDDSESDEDDLEGEEMEEFVICTLDPQKNYQQPLDITIGEHERVYFAASGTHDIFLTGNYVLPPDEHNHDHDEDDYDSEEDYDLEPDSDEILSEDDEDEEDELDGLQDPGITELDTDEDEEAPKLVKADTKKSKKRAAEDDADTLDDLINKSLKPEEANGEPKLSKKQAKKLKKNDGKAVEAAPQEAAKKDQKETNGEKKDKKVQFAKNLEQGPTGSPKVEEKKDGAAKTGPRVVQGVTIDDKKIGKGPGAKKGDKIEIRYIGKLKNGKQFDANKKGKPFSFKVGTGEVVKGMDIGVLGLTVGGERRITIPAKLGYGNRAMGSDIPANSDLIFDIKCLGLH